MSAKLPSLWPAILLVASLSTAFAADPAPPTPQIDELRAGITKSLGFLEKEGEHWMATKDCNGCHHMPGMIRSFHEAAWRGFPVDEKKLAGWLAWADERATDKKPGLEEAAFMIFATPERPAPELAKLIAEAQTPDGSWKPAGQLADMQLRGSADAQANSTRLFLLALATPEGTSEAAEGARAKAAAWLGQEAPAKSVDTLMYRLLYAQKFGPPKDVESIRQQLLARQRRDGGWSYILDQNQSDALGTGEVLYALAAAPDASAEKAIARGQDWLLSTQRDDGSWPMDYTHLSKIDRSDAARAKSRQHIAMIYTYWGSAWATIGLLQAVPVEGSGAKAAPAESSLDSP